MDGACSCDITGSAPRTVHDMGDGVINHFRPCCRRYLLWKNDGNSRGQPTYIWLQPLSEDGLRFTAPPTQLIRNDQVSLVAVSGCECWLIALPTPFKAINSTIPKCRCPTLEPTFFKSCTEVG